jgi:hypothetical protein
MHEEITGDSRGSHEEREERSGWKQFHGEFRAAFPSGNPAH